MRTRLSLTLAIAAIVIAGFGGCTREEQNRIKNVKPPRPGTPASGSDVTGIYRSLDFGLLQLRANGTYNLVTKDAGATSGQFTLSDGRLEVLSDECGETLGRYDLVVTGKQEAGKAQLQITPVADPCAERNRTLTERNPWVYANS